jgi:hypothetical protein
MLCGAVCQFECVTSHELGRRCTNHDDGWFLLLFACVPDGASALVVHGRTNQHRGTSRQTLRLVQHLDEYGRDGHLDTWLVVCTSRVAMDHLSGSGVDGIENPSSIFGQRLSW